ncbi:MAG: copper chaperone PCu(A)C [Tistlia sp.]|uniref:copper chaperone PCu(A)C n=1 Tax=Tistlia sp. TaxID=3057121 RepID=UPI0034A5089F
MSLRTFRINLIPINLIHVAGALVALLIALVAVAQAHDHEVAELRVGHPWARASAGAAASGAAYMTIENLGTEPDRLIAVATPASKRAELHTHLEENGVMKMRQVEGGIELPAGATVALAPGGLHVMLMGLAAPLEQGARFPMTLTFEKAGTLSVDIAVEAIGFRPAGHGEGHGHQ